MSGAAANGGSTLRRSRDTPGVCLSEVTHPIGELEGRLPDDGSTAERKPVESVDIIQPMPTLPTGPTTIARKSPEQRSGSLYASTSGQLLVSVEEELEVDRQPGTKVGDYVPFYFCPRSVMLFVIHRANHPELTYRDGQGPIVHLEADLHAVVQWAKESGRRWAFSLSNAGAYYTEFRSRLDELDQLDWQVIAATDFRPAEVKERKQAEFLLHGRFPFELIERIGVRSADIQERAATALAGTRHRPPIEVHREWYF